MQPKKVVHAYIVTLAMLYQLNMQVLNMQVNCMCKLQQVKFQYLSTDEYASSEACLFIQFILCSQIYHNILQEYIKNRRPSKLSYQTQN